MMIDGLWRLGERAVQPAQCSVGLVEPRDGFQKHQRARASDDGEPVLFAQIDSLLGYRARTADALEQPHRADASGDAAANDVSRLVAVHHDDDPVQLARHGRQILVAGVAGDGDGVRVHRERLVSMAAKLGVDRATKALLVVRGANDSDAPAGQELPHGGLVNHLVLQSFGGLLPPRMRLVLLQAAVPKVP